MEDNMRNHLKYLITLFAFTMVISSIGYAQDKSQTILETKVLRSLIDETSGALQMHHLMELGGYPHDRQANEYAGTYYETQYIYEKAQEYGFSDVKIERWPSSSLLWDGQVGELWLLEPEERLFISYRDITTTLAPNSSSGDWTGEVIFVGDGYQDSDYEGKDIKDNFVLTSGSPRGNYRLAVKKYGAVGILSYSVINHPHIIPDKIAWNSLPTGGGFMGMGQQDTTPPPEAFGFNLSPRMGQELKNLISRGGGRRKVMMKAIVKAEEREVDNELVTALIPGDGSTEKEIVYTAHLFEGVHKQGANDNHSGCASILEAGRAIVKLIDEGKISRPALNLRFLWVPEISGSFLYLVRFPEETRNMEANVNLDMVGEDVFKNQNSLRVFMSLKSRAHCIDDIAAALFDWMGYINLWDNGGSQAFSLGPVVDPMGTQAPFHYNVMPYSGGSDHIVFQLQPFKIPAVFFNNWPDMVYHTSHDRPDMSDPTQLKRSAILAAAIGIAAGGGENSDVVRVGSECMARSFGRILQKTRSELSILSATSDSLLLDRFRDARYIIQGITAIENQSLTSLQMFVENDARGRRYVTHVLKELANTEAIARRNLDEGYRALCSSRGLRFTMPKTSAIEKELAKWIPNDVSKTLPKEDDGEMSLFSFFMGPRISVRGLGRNESSELRNFIDGKRNLLEIRNAVSAEYAPVPLEAVKEYFEKLEEGGHITIKK